MAKAETAKTTKKATTAKKTVAKKVKNAPVAQAVGRRKSAVARVWLRKGNGTITINGRNFEEYFPVTTSRLIGEAAFKAIPMSTGFNADINLHGGGYTAQASAVNLGISRALLQFDETLKPELRKLGFLTVDSRVKERKKYGQKGARAKFQFTKR